MPANIVVGTQWGDEGRVRLLILSLPEPMWSFVHRAVIMQDIL